MSLDANFVTEQQYRILVLDESLNAARSTLSHLTEAGFECHYAQGGSAGLTAHETLQPHLVLIDIVSPATQGGHICKAIRANSKVPIIVLTEEHFTLQPHQHIGANEYAPKNLPIETLLERIEALLQCVYGIQTNIEMTNSHAIHHIPTGWAVCEFCNYMGPRSKFEVIKHGEPHLACPHCKHDDSLVLGI